MHNICILFITYVYIYDNHKDIYRYSYNTIRNMKQYPFSLLIHNIWPPVYVLYIGVITSFHAVCFNVQ